MQKQQMNMERNFIEAVRHRRSYYDLSNESPVTDDRLKEMIKQAVLHTPSPFNSQSTRIVLLLGKNHKKLWDMTKKTLKKIVSESDFHKTEEKIEKSFASGYGTILFYEDRSIVEELQRTAPTYHEKFPQWSQHTNAMHQFVIWTMLEDVGFGASLQHYNPLIDQEISETWDIPEHWELIAQMPFGIPTKKPGEKEFKPLEERYFIFE